MSKRETRFLPDGQPNPRWRPTKRSSLVDKNFFIAWDGEGVSYPDGSHEYILFMAAHPLPDGDFRYYICTPKKKGEFLTTRDITAFIAWVLERLPEQGIHVGFGLNYDTTQMFKGLPWAEVKNALSDTFATYGRFQGGRFKLRPRKYVEIWFDKPRKTKWRKHIRIWDVWGFFQSSFVTAIEQWLGKDYPDLGLIREGKLARGYEDDEDALIEYTKAELRALIRMMEKLNLSLQQAGLRLSRWDGPGAAAAAAFKRHFPTGWFGKTREAFARYPDLYTAVRHAYFGGRIELIRFGHVHNQTLYQYDINSAYPAACIGMPDLTRGRWVRGDVFRVGRDAMALYRVRWDFSGKILCPFPLREESGTVLFPERGEGWYWHPEVEAALQAIERDEGKKPSPYNYAGAQVMILDCWRFIPETDNRPFAWVGEYYQRRLEARRRGEQGLQLALKLVINSVYGKMAQQIGYKPATEDVTDYVTGEKQTVVNGTSDIIPPFYNLAYAGFITSHCRGQLFRAASQRPEAIVALATDGILSLKKLNLPVTGEKVLGEWECTVMKDCYGAVVQSGVNCLYYDGLWHEKSRGFVQAGQGKTLEERQPEIRARFEMYMNGWRYRKHSVFLPVRKFVTLKGAAAGNEPSPQWENRGKWFEDMREIELWPPGNSKKRWPYQNGNAHEKLLLTAPRCSLLYEYPVSVPYDAIPLSIREEWREVRDMVLEMADIDLIDTS